MKPPPLPPDVYRVLSLLERREQGLSYQTVGELLDLPPFEAAKILNACADESLVNERPIGGGYLDLSRFTLTPSGLSALETRRPKVGGVNVPKEPRFKP